MAREDAKGSEGMKKQSTILYKVMAEYCYMHDPVYTGIQQCKIDVMTSTSFCTLYNIYSYIEYI